MASRKNPIPKVVLPLPAGLTIADTELPGSPPQFIQKQDGTIEKRPHGNMDETLVPKGKGNPPEGPYVPEHHGVDPDTSHDPSDHPGASQTSVPDGRRRAASPRERHVAYP